MTDFTSGIYDTIGATITWNFPAVFNPEAVLLGYKEFREYLASSERSEASFDDAVRAMKQSTRRYARAQVTWVRNKFLPIVRAANVNGLVTPTYLLDASGEFLVIVRVDVAWWFSVDKRRWKTNVQDIGLQITEGAKIYFSQACWLNRVYTDFLAERDLPDPATLSDSAHEIFSIGDKAVE